ncbi:MAG: hypothetical protein GXP17_05565 [Gammaproteobacteria bacterium]|nr:hypothetical protein [Gammaproteobacteria bacterium]
MNCTEFHKAIDDYRDGGPGFESGAAQRNRCDQHLQDCRQCAERLSQHDALQQALRAMPIPEPSLGFAERALRMAAEQNPVQQHQGDGGLRRGAGDHHQHRHHGFMMGFGSAVAAALALWVVVGLFPQPMPGDAPTVAEDVPVVTIALNEQRDIKLAFFSDHPLKGARISIQMPENVALAGFPGQRELSWETNLAQGDNLLRLPVVATGAAVGELVARIEYGDQYKVLRVNIETRAPDLSGNGQVRLPQGVWQTVG